METNLEREKRLRKKAMSLPLRPGVYLMKDKSGGIIYIGKAKALKNRVSSYFGSHRNHQTKVIRMVENVQDFDYIICDSEFEALVLECSLIKQHTPKYNILLKDDKGYHYVKVTEGPWSKIEASFHTDDPTARYFGPYTSSFAV
ncbi:MAG TPA: excinuclease ABC subunit UvrC, partial [Ruminococcaceae bacterium]|nr:excinuclease ABC subunit UvrC [Oscillospiraceae bacterium]